MLACCDPKGQYMVLDLYGDEGAAHVWRYRLEILRHLQALPATEDAAVVLSGQ